VELDSVVADEGVELDFEVDVLDDELESVEGELTLNGSDWVDGVESDDRDLELDDELNDFDVELELDDELNDFDVELELNDLLEVDEMLDESVEAVDGVLLDRDEREDKVDSDLLLDELDWVEADEGVLDDEDELLLVDADDGVLLLNDDKDFELDDELLLELDSVD
jgi:hypothetical protein